MRGLVLVVLVACAHASPVGELRFKNQPPVWRVNDRMRLASAPKPRAYNAALYHTDGFFIRRATRAMDLKPDRRATDTNALDEVPDSTWFTNRIGVRELTIEELRRGPNFGPNPFDHRPWTITEVKHGGTAIGFIFLDARGDKYLLKFEAPDKSEEETAAHAIVHRILWACGYNVPQDYIGVVRREDLVLGASPSPKGFDAAKLAAALAKVDHLADGSMRVLASRYLAGTPIGPYAREGTRADDPNDVIPHERRRSLRGQFPIFAWLNHTDLQEDNTLDMFIEDGYVVHYLVDFGKALGVMGLGLHRQTPGFTYKVDLAMALGTLFSFGLWKRPWDTLDETGLRGIRLYDAAHFDPGAWRAHSLYWPYEDKDRFDAFWGAKLVMRFTREQLAAIVDEGRFSDPRARAYMLDTLVARQRKTGQYWFDRVAPLDRFVLDGERLCFTDLALAYRLRAPRTHYRLETYDKRGRPTGDRRALVPVQARACTTIPVRGYTIARIRVYRDDRPMPPVLVHLALDGRGHPAIIGLRRE